MSECACSYVRVCVCHNVTRLSEDKLSFHAHYTMFEGGNNFKKNIVFLKGKNTVLNYQNVLENVFLDML